MSDDESQSEGDLDENEEDEDEEEEEYREVDPMQVIEERLMLLEAWLHEDPYQEDVNHKRDEYLSLMEELEILGKKMRKTDKMLALPNQPNIAKLERKREQYEREVTDIVLYAEQDTFFDLDGENGEAAMVAYMKANSLLGRPLETLAEMPGFEDSKAWNDSFGPLDTRSIREDASSRPSSSSDLGSSRRGKNKNNKSNNSFDNSYNNSSAQLDLSQPHNITVLKKKLKKAKQLLEDTTSEKERKRLFKKIGEYKEALSKAEEQNQKDGSETTDEEDNSNASEESIDPPLRSPVKVFATNKPSSNTSLKNNSSNTSNSTQSKQESEDEDDEDEAMYRLLKRKLSKATRLSKSAATSKQRQKYHVKVQQYLASLNQFDAWKNDQLAYGYDAGHSVEEESHETEWMEQQAAADEQRLAHEELQLQETQRRRTHAKTMLDSRKLNQDVSPKESVVKKKTPSSASSASSSLARNGSGPEDDSLDLEKYVDDERKQNKTLRKKLAKVEGMIDDKLKKEGDEARYTKEFRKLQKKRKQYLTELGEDHASLANLSGGGSSMNMSANPHDSASEMSSNSFRLEDMIEEDDEEERHYQQARQARLQEQQRVRQERLAASRDKKPPSNEEDEEVELLRKKLKKVGKMLMNTEKGSKEYAKLLKKKKEYLAQLGEAG